MKTERTAGRWVANGVVVTALLPDGLHCSDIAVTDTNSYGESNGLPRAEQEANAALMATSPELLWSVERALAIRDNPNWTKSERERSWAAWKQETVQILANLHDNVFPKTQHSALST